MGLKKVKLIDMRAGYIIVVLIFYSKFCCSQDRVDTLVQNFLVQNHEIDTAIFSQVKSKKRTITQSNYFIKRELDLKIYDKEISMYAFGTYSTHGNNFLLIDVYSKSTNEYLNFFLGKTNLNEDLKTLLLIFENNPELSVGVKKQIIENLLNVY